MKLRKKKFYKDTQGNKYNLEEFLKKWGEGLRGVTPLQSTKVQYKSGWLMVIGIIAGIVISLMGFKNLWWLTLILLGALFNIAMQQLGLWQKIKIFEKLEGGKM